MGRWADAQHASNMIQTMHMHMRMHMPRRPKRIQPLQAPWLAWPHAWHFRFPHVTVYTGVCLHERGHTHITNTIEALWIHYCPEARDLDRVRLQSESSPMMPITA